MAVILPKSLVSCVFLLVAVINGTQSNQMCNLDTSIENTLRNLLSPQEDTIQVQALRRELIKKFQEALERAEGEDDRKYKSPLSSMSAWNDLPDQKRNLEALARAGYLKTLSDEEDGDINYKRSLANLAKNGQLPIHHESQKRGIESLARNGDLHPKKDIQEEIDDVYEKRNIGSLARNYNFPNYGKRSLSSLARSGDLNYPRLQFKRNIASLAREGQFTGKRNVAALLRQNDYLNGLHKQSEYPEGRDEKRSLQSIKAQYKSKVKRSTDQITSRNKREADYYIDENAEYPTPVYQNQNIYDYEDMLQDLAGIYPNNEKRFLGSVARTGWFRPSNSRYVSPEKRHIGSLARLGWLPTLRNIRRFNRSGRSTSSDDTCREDTADGDNNAISKEAPLSLKEQRYLLEPTVDNILLRRVFMHPRSH